MANELLTPLNSSVAIVYPRTGFPTSFFHIAWQRVIDAIRLLQAALGTILDIDGGSASNSGTPYIAIDGGSA